MALTLTAAPLVEPFLLADARLHLRLDADASGHPDDALVEQLITAARQHVDGADGWLGRALITQEWELTLPAFPCWDIIIPLPPLQTIDSIKYIDNDGVLQTLSASVYQVVAGEPSRVVPAYNQSWPTTRCQPDAVTVAFTAGYGDAGTDVPAPIVAALKLHLGVLYRDREATGAVVTPLPLAYEALLAPFKVW